MALFAICELVTQLESMINQIANDRLDTIDTRAWKKNEPRKGTA